MEYLVSLEAHVGGEEERSTFDLSCLLKTGEYFEGGWADVGDWAKGDGVWALIWFLFDVGLK